MPRDDGENDEQDAPGSRRDGQEDYESQNGAAPPAPEQQSLVSRVKALAEALKGSEVSELDLTEDGARIYIRRQLEAPVVLPRGYGMPMARAGQSRRARAEDAPAAEPAPEPTVAVVAPLTGVYYSAASPNSPPFAQVGEPIQAGQIVCIIEAMKVFNEIKSEVAGTVTAVVAKNGQLVHKGDALIRVKPI